MNIELIWNPKLLSDIFAVDKLNNPASIIHQIRIDRNRNNDKIIILTLEQYQEPWPPIPPNLGHTFISILGQCWLTNHTFWTDQNRWKNSSIFWTLDIHTAWIIMTYDPNGHTVLYTEHSIFCMTSFHTAQAYISVTLYC